MFPVSPVQVDIKPENSFNNWRCCFGCKCWKVINSTEEKQESPVSMQVVETVTRTYEKHRHSSSPEQSIMPSAPVFPRMEYEMPPHLRSSSVVAFKEVKEPEEKK